MTFTPCPHGYPKPTMCLSCMESGPVAPPARWQLVGRPFNAAHPGRCERCDDVIVAGERIIREDLDDDRARYVHMGCRA